MNDFSRAPGEAELPDPPDNVQLWEELPDALRETVANQFERGINAEINALNDRHARGERLIAARQREQAANHAAYVARKARRDGAK